MRYQTYNSIIKYLKGFATQHLDVKRFAEEDEDQMSSITSMEELFPMIFVTPIDSSFDYDLNEYSFRIYCYDRLMKDRSNIQNARSKTNLILNDLDVWLRKESELPFEITDVTYAQPFSSELMSDVTGWYIEVRIDNPSFSVCEIPFENTPELPLGVCDGIPIETDKCPLGKYMIFDIEISGGTEVTTPPSGGGKGGGGEKPIQGEERLYTFVIEHNFLMDNLSITQGILTNDELLLNGVPITFNDLPMQLNIGDEISFMATVYIDGLLILTGVYN